MIIICRLWTSEYWIIRNIFFSANNVGGMQTGLLDMTIVKKCSWCSRCSLNSTLGLNLLTYLYLIFPPSSQLEFFWAFSLNRVEFYSKLLFSWKLFASRLLSLEFKSQKLQHHNKSNRKKRTMSFAADPLGFYLSVQAHITLLIKIVFLIMIWMQMKKHSI